MLDHHSVLGGRFEHILVLAGGLAHNGKFRGAIDREEAADIIWTLASPECTACSGACGGWSAERYRAWLADTLVRTLIV